MSLFLGSNSIFWVGLVAAIVLVLALGGGGRGRGSGEGESPVAHFGLLAEFHLVNEEEEEMADVGERPQVKPQAASGCKRSVENK